MASEASMPVRVDEAYPERCPHCGEELAHPKAFDQNITRQAIYRRHRRNHFGWGGQDDYDPDDDPLLSRNTGAGEEELNEEHKFDTQYYRVEFRDEYKQEVVVEAHNESKAEEIADLERDPMHAEPVQTLHTESRAVGEASQASIDYLEKIGLLPADHDVSEEDIQELADEQWEKSDEVRDDE